MIAIDEVNDERARLDRLGDDRAGRLVELARPGEAVDLRSPRSSHHRLGGVDVLEPIEDAEVLVFDRSAHRCLDGFDIDDLGL